MLDGAARVKDLVRAVAADNQPAVAITDHGVLYGVVDFVKAAKEEGDKAKQNVDGAKTIIVQARESLKTAQKMLENQGREALRKAEERSKKFGEESEKMSAIAREARTLAEQ